MTARMRCRTRRLRSLPWWSRWGRVLRPPACGRSRSPSERPSFRKGVGFKGRFPLRPVLDVLPGMPVLGYVLPGQLLEGGCPRESCLFPLHRQRVSTGLHQGAVLSGLLTGLRQGHRGMRAQTNILAPSLNGNPLHPGLIPTGPDHQVQGFTDDACPESFRCGSPQQLLRRLGHILSHVSSHAISRGWHKISEEPPQTST